MWAVGPGEIGQIVALVMTAALAGVIGFALARGSRTASGGRRRGAGHGGHRGGDLADIREQLRAVMLAPFERQQLLSESEYRAFRIIEEEVAVGRRGCRVFAQTSMGEILRSPSRSAFRSINSKRIDVLVVDAGGWPLLAVAFQDDGHDQDNAAGRNAVKREALRKAGVPYLEIYATDADELIRSRVRELLGGASAASADGPAGW